RQRTPVKRDRVGGGPSAADELRAISLPFNRTAQPSVDPKDVESPNRLLVLATGAAAEQQAGVLRVVLGLDEELPEGRMGEVVFGASQHDLGVAGDLDFPRPTSVVGDRQPPDF